MSKEFEFKPQKPIYADQAGNILEDPSSVQEAQDLEGGLNNESGLEEDVVLDERLMDPAKDEIKAIEDSIAAIGDIPEGTENPEKDSRRERPVLTKLKKAAAAMTLGTVFAMAMAGNAEAAKKPGFDLGLKSGMNKAGQDLGKAIGKGLSKGAEQIVSNIFGIETKEQEKARLQYEKKVEMEQRQEFKRAEMEQRQMEKRTKELETRYLNEINIENKRYVEAQRKLTDKVANGKITREDYDYLMSRNDLAHENMIKAIKDTYGVNGAIGSDMGTSSESAQ